MTTKRRKATFISSAEKEILKKQLQARIGGGVVCRDISLGAPVAWGFPPKSRVKPSFIRGGRGM